MNWISEIFDSFFDALMPIMIVGTISYFIYRLFENIIHRRERLKIIEAMGDKLSPELLKSNQGFNFDLNLKGNFNTPSAVKWGCFLMGIGLGFILAFLVCTYNIPGFAYSGHRNDYNYEAASSVFAAFSLLCGGLGLVLGTLLQYYMNNKFNNKK